MRPHLYPKPCSALYICMDTFTILDRDEASSLSKIVPRFMHMYRIPLRLLGGGEGGGGGGGVVLNWFTLRGLILGFHINKRCLKSKCCLLYKHECY